MGQLRVGCDRRCARDYRGPIGIFGPVNLHGPFSGLASKRAGIALAAIALVSATAGCSSPKGPAAVASASSSSAPSEPASGDGCAANVGDASAIAALAEKSLSGALASIANASDFAAYLEASTQANTALDKASGYAIFVPTNDAFAKLTPDQKAAIDTDPVKRDAMLLYAVTAVPLVPSKLTAAQQVPTVYGPSSKLTVTTSGANIMLDGQATAVCRNIATGSGAIYLTDTVIFPAA